MYLDTILHVFVACFRTITTKMNSIKQTKKAIYPVRFDGMDEGEEQGDVLWCTEMERLVILYMLSEFDVVCENNLSAKMFWGRGEDKNVVCKYCTLLSFPLSLALLLLI